MNCPLRRPGGDARRALATALAVSLIALTAPAAEPAAPAAEPTAPAAEPTAPAAEPAAPAAEPAARRKVTVGPRYGASGFHRGDARPRYRALWTTPIEVEVLDLAREAGGLSPVRRVGGQQTHGLALAGQDGRSYTFRGLDKDPSNILPEELQDTFVEELVQDQMAAQHPAGALVADELARAAGVPTVPIRLVVLPDDPALGEERKDFAGLVGTFSEYPTAADARHPGFEGAVEIVDHMTLYAKLAQDPGERVAVREFLRARLFDVFVSDFDRHRKQWRWAKRRRGRPLAPDPRGPRPGLRALRGPARARGRRRTCRSCGPSAPKYDRILGLTYNGREQDRWLLPELSREAWREVAGELKARLTDEVIERAARRMPPEWYAIDGARLVAALKERRDTLPAGGRPLLPAPRRPGGRAGHGRRRGGARAAARGRRGRGRGGAARAEGGTAGTPYFSRRFVPGETEEVRLYLRGGNDRVVVEGRGGGVDGARGRRVRATTCSTTRRAAGRASTTPRATTGGARARARAWDDRAYTPPPGPKNAPWIPPRDWGRDWFALPWAELQLRLRPLPRRRLRDPELRLPPAALREPARAARRLGLRREPAAGSSTTATFHRRELGRDARGCWPRYSGLEVQRYYGFGNETTAEADDDFNKVRQQAGGRSRRSVDASRSPAPLDFTVAPGAAVRGDRGGRPAGRPSEAVRLRRLRAGRRLGPPAARQPARRPLGGAAAQPAAAGCRGGAATRRAACYSRRSGRVFPKAWDVEKTYGWVEGERLDVPDRGLERPGDARPAGGGRQMRDMLRPTSATRSSTRPRSAAAGLRGQDTVRGFAPEPLHRRQLALRERGPAALPLALLPGAARRVGPVRLRRRRARVWLRRARARTRGTRAGAAGCGSACCRARTRSRSRSRSRDERTAFYVRAGFSF